MYLLQALAGVEMKIATAIAATNSTVFMLDQKMRKWVIISFLRTFQLINVDIEILFFHGF